jgi:hypothetical protein
MRKASLCFSSVKSVFLLLFIQSLFHLKGKVIQWRLCSGKNTNLSILRPEEVDQALITPKLGGEVEKSFSVAADGFVKPVHHGSAYVWVWVHVLARNTGLAITYRPLPPYPVDGDSEAHGLGDSAVVFYLVLYAVAEFALHLAALLGYGGLL